MSKKLVLVDGDALTYQSSKDTLQESINILDEKIQNILDKTEADYYAIFISNSPYFRHLVDKNYKSSREKYKTSLKWLKTLKKYLVEGHYANSMNLVESDDLVAYWKNKNLHIADDSKIEPKETFDDALDYCKQMKLDLFHYEPLEVIIASPDKDLLKSIPGKHFNYTYKLENKDNPDSVIKGWWVETTKEEASNFKLWQLIVGDSSDNVTTPFPENCANWIVEGDADLLSILGGYIEGFDYRTPKGQIKFKEGYGISKGIYEYQKNYRLLHLLDCDEDFYREVQELPESPTVLPVIREEKVDELKDVSF